MSQAVLTAKHESVRAPASAAIGEPLPAHSSVFSEQEVAGFHDADRSVARVIVCMMSGIFTIGLVMYTIIAWLAAQGGH